MKEWYALRSKPKKEAQAAALLERAGIEMYLPMVTTSKGLGMVSQSEPLFPGYLFSRLDPLRGELQMARYTHGVLYVVGFGDQPCPVPDDLILSIKERIARSRGRKALPEFHRGDRVVVTSGPFRDVEAIFDSQLSAAGRAMVLMQMLQRLCRAEVHIGQLRLVTQVAGRAGS